MRCDSGLTILLLSDGMFGRCHRLPLTEVSTYHVSPAVVQRFRILLEKLSSRGEGPHSSFTTPTSSPHHLNRHTTSFTTPPQSPRLPTHSLIHPQHFIEERQTIPSADHQGETNLVAHWAVSHWSVVSLVCVSVVCVSLVCGLTGLCAKCSVLVCGLTGLHWSVSHWYVSHWSVLVCGLTGLCLTGLCSLVCCLTGLHWSVSHWSVSHWSVLVCVSLVCVCTGLCLTGLYWSVV